jgi:hypothetical protein
MIQGHPKSPQGPSKRRARLQAVEDVTTETRDESDTKKGPPAKECSQPIKLSKQGNKFSHQGL